MFVHFLPMLLVVLAAQTSSDGGMKVGEIIAVVSVLVNILMAIFTFILSRKASTEERLRKAETDRAAEAQAAMKAYIDVAVSQLRTELVNLQGLIEDTADADTVDELRADLKDLRKAVGDLEVKLVSHHGVCSGKFVDRNTYDATNNAQRETIKMIHEMIKQQAAIIEKLRS